VLKSQEKWLAMVPWEAVVEINQQLCQSNKNTPHKPGKGFDEARKLWEEAVPRSLPFREALDICHTGHKLAPFAFFNGNTFALVMGRILQDTVNQLPVLEAQMLKTTVAHYVAGVIKSGELESMCIHVDELLRKR
jgi:hypothetical protein